MLSLPSACSSGPANEAEEPVQGPGRAEPLWGAWPQLELPDLQNRTEPQRQHSPWAGVNQHSFMFPSVN